LSHPKCGASWEGYAIEEVLRTVDPDEAYFWATHGGAEMDLVLIKSGPMVGVECKRMDGPRLTPSIHIAMEDLKLDHVAIVYPGTRRYGLAERVNVVPLRSLAEGGAEALFTNAQLVEEMTEHDACCL